jgi:hypothetical protein
MIKKILLIILLAICLSPILRAQQYSYDYLVKQYCQKAKDAKLDQLSKENIFAANIELSKEIRQENADTIEAIINNIQVENDTLTQMEAMIIYSKHYIHSLIYSCNYYLKINRSAIASCPDETKSLQYITLRINQYLRQHPDYTYKQVLDSAGTKGFEYSKEIEDQVKSDYEIGIIYPKTMINYLLHKSDLFFQAWLYNQSMKLFD